MYPPFPLEELYIPVATIIGFFLVMVLLGQVYQYCVPSYKSVKTPRRLQGILEDGWRCHLPDSNSSSSSESLRILTDSTRHWRRHLCSTCVSSSAQVPGEDSNTHLKTQQIYTLSNAISFSRLVSAPGVAWLIASEQWQMSLIAITLAGVSDLLDGYIAKSFNQESVLGSYLDPLADKAVLCACFAALGWNGTLSPTLVGVVLSRDVLLVLAHFYHRATVLNWQPSSITEFFQTSSVNGSPVAERVQPLLVGKISTFVQFALVGACVFSGAVGEPVTNAYTNLLIANTYIWTAGSGVAYLITCPWLKGSDKAFMLVSGLTACSLYHMWPA